MVEKVITMLLGLMNWMDWPMRVVQEWRDYFQFTTAGNMLDEATGQPTGFNIFHPKSESPIFDLAFFRSQCSLFRKQHRHAPQKILHLLFQVMLG